MEKIYVLHVPSRCKRSDWIPSVCMERLAPYPGALSETVQRWRILASRHWRFLTEYAPSSYERFQGLRARSRDESGWDSVSPLKRWSLSASTLLKGRDYTLTDHYYRSFSRSDCWVHPRDEFWLPLNRLQLCNARNAIDSCRVWGWALSRGVVRKPQGWWGPRNSVLGFSSRWRLKASYACCVLGCGKELVNETQPSQTRILPYLRNNHLQRYDCLGSSSWSLLQHSVTIVGNAYKIPGDRSWTERLYEMSRSRSP